MNCEYMQQILFDGVTDIFAAAFYCLVGSTEGQRFAVVNASGTPCNPHSSTDQYSSGVFSLDRQMFGKTTILISHQHLCDCVSLPTEHWPSSESYSGLPEWAIAARVINQPGKRGIAIWMFEPGLDPPFCTTEHVPAKTTLLSHGIHRRSPSSIPMDSSSFCPVRIF